MSDERAAIVGYGRALLARAVRAAWAGRSLTVDPDGLFSTLLGSKDVEHLLAVAEGRAEASGPALFLPTPARPPMPRLEALAAAVGAGEHARAILALAMSVELDATARTLAGYLRGNSLGAAVAFGTLVHAFGEEATAEVYAALGPGGPVRRHRLVEVSERGGELLASASLRAAPRLLRWLVDPGQLDDEVGELASLRSPSAAPELPSASLRALEAAVQEVRSFLGAGAFDRPSDFVLRGPRGSGRGEVAREACRRLGRPSLVAAAALLVSHPRPAEAAALLLREALLLDAQLVIEGAESMGGADEASLRVRAALGASSRPLLLTSTTSEQLRLSAARALLVRDLGIADGGQREEMWRELVPGVDAEPVASLYRVGVGAMQRVAAGARLRAEVRAPGARVSADDIASAVRSEFETDLGTVATRVTVTQTWEDLVVAEETRRTIDELTGQLRHRATVLGRWGFGRKLGKGLGTTALFSGEPGTGKSMVAGLIARELGLELYQIDLSRVLSKWIGETEKNLARVFDAAEVGHVVLLFDEADALLGKRTADVKSANDRYANIETNYILQRLEAFHGVAILTSNLESALNPAMSRRLTFELRFPFPDEEQRAELWRRLLPAELPLDGDFDFAMLAQRFELAGGHVRNVVLRAAYLAASDGARALGMQHLMRAAEYEYRDHGMLVAQGRLSKR